MQSLWSLYSCLLLFEVSLGLISVQATAAPFRWEQGEGFRSAALPILEQGKPGFTLVPAAVTGITFSNILSDAKIAENQIRLNGSGVACGDIDADGWCDLYFCGLENGNRLYRNLGGWKFEDITEAAGVACTNQYSTGAVFADVDGNGSLDLLVNGLGVGTRLFLNDGHGHFHEVTASGLVRKYAATSLALADVNGDGYLDLYVANYRTTTIRSTGLPLLKINGQLSIRPEDREDYELNPQGLIIEHGAPDLYVCNDFMTPDRIWINDGRGHFRAISRVALRNTSTFSMAVDFADIN